MDQFKMTSEEVKQQLGPEGVANLEILFNYLAHGELKAEFNMGLYYKGQTIGGQGMRMTDCGSGGCAVGHGPYAGIPKREDESWNDYVERVFKVEIGKDMFRFLFHSEWKRDDNTPTGAAKRIRYLLDYGLPIGRHYYDYKEITI